MSTGELFCDNCGRRGVFDIEWAGESHLPDGWRHHKGAVYCDDPECSPEEVALMERDLVALGTIGPQDPTP